MASEYLSVPPVYQGNTNYCWAACMEWWLKAVRKYQNYDMDKIIYMFSDYIQEDEEGGDSGSLTEQGMYKLLNYQGWHMWYEESHNSRITAEKFDKLLKRSPFLIGYTEFDIGTDAEGNQLQGFHMNVIVERNGEEFTVMDPNFTEFQTRSYEHYRKGAYENFYAYSMKLGSTPVYGYYD